MSRLSFILRSGLPATALAVLLLVQAGAAPVAAGAFSVNTPVDAVDDAPGDGVCETASVTCSLRAAIEEANALDGTDSINVPADTYALSVADGDGSVDLDVTSAMTITGAGASTTFVDAAGIDRVFDVAADGFAGISNLTVRNGNATSGLADGGGVRNSGAGSQLLLSNVTLDGNDAPIATLGGGGLFNSLGSVTIADSTISGNTSPGGGAIANEGGSVNLTNVTLSGNSAPKGGAIYNYSGSLSTNNVTISANTSANGAVFVDGGSVTFRNTIIGTNSATNCVAEQGGAFFTTGHNLSSDNSCPSTAAGDLPNTDPQLSPLADNGGTTATHALQATSPAIDAGDDSGCAGTDQRGTDRPQGAHCDIGAFELEVQASQGDFDCSGGVNAVDALKVLRFVASLTVMQSVPCPHPGSDVSGHPFGDVDCSGAVDSVDALKILRHSAALGVTQTEPCTHIADPL